MKYFERESSIVELVRGKRVLHLGCIGFADAPADERVELFQQSLHFRLSHIADVTGVDYAASVVEQLQRRNLGMNIIVGNVERMSELAIEGQFDVILAGDIIEHVNNPGRMLAGISRFAGPDTELILTTPNAFGLLSQIRHAFGRFHEAREHVMSFNRFNITQLLKRYGYSIIAIDTCYQHWADREHSAIALKLAKVLFRTVPRWGGTLFIRARLTDGAKLPATSI